jgi:hypothetical protein
MVLNLAANSTSIHFHADLADRSHSRQKYMDSVDQQDAWA